MSQKPETFTITVRALPGPWPEPIRRLGTLLKFAKRRTGFQCVDIKQGSEEWLNRQAEIQEAANKKRSEAAKGRDRNADGTLASGGSTCSTTGSKHESRSAKAADSKTNMGAVARGDLLDSQWPRHD